MYVCVYIYIYYTCAYIYIYIYIHNYHSYDYYHYFFININTIIISITYVMIMLMIMIMNIISIIIIMFMIIQCSFCDRSDAEVPRAGPRASPSKDSDPPGNKLHTKPLIYIYMYIDTCYIILYYIISCCIETFNESISSEPLSRPLARQALIASPSPSRAAVALGDAGTSDISS